ncbi:unnamed protein product [Schistocephalus solidus]|uniref:Protein kinase domain-containing protein n=1 Tax=Schistocephalus solidus TaxID=70667 RepID=A0A183SEE2_SCHSO|nr:unnamed protein product [Schistocephalus solidus]
MTSVRPLRNTAYENFALKNNYEVSELLGSGAYGRVFKGTSPNGLTVALKEIVIPADDQGIPLSTLRELSVLKKVQAYNSPYLVHVIGFPPASEWPRVSFLKQGDFKKVGEHNILRSKVKTTDESALNLIECMLTFNPLKRIPACEALRMPFFASTEAPSRSDLLSMCRAPATAGPSVLSHGRTSLRPSSTALTSRPFLPNRHSLTAVSTTSHSRVQRQQQRSYAAAACRSCETAKPPAAVFPAVETSTLQQQRHVDSPNNAWGVQNHRPMTRQLAAAIALQNADAETAALINRMPAPSIRGARRYTQPCRSTRLRVQTPPVVSIPEAPEPLPLSTQTVASSGIQSSASSSSPSVTTVAGTTTTGRGRQKRVARRRTVMGVERVCLPLSLLY